MKKETIYEVFDSLTNNCITDTTSRKTAEEWYTKGYLIVEHRIVTILVSSTRKIVLTDCEYWAE